MKKLKLTNKYLLNRTSTLSQVMQERLPVRATYALTKNIDTINTALEPFNKTVGKIRNKFAKKDDKGEPICDKKTGNQLIEDIEGCNKAMEELLDIEVSIDIMQFSLANLGDVNLSGVELNAIRFMLEDF